MNLKTVLIETNGKKSIVFYTSFAQMQKAVGGYIEAIPFDIGTAYLNEEGIAKKLPVNPTATRLCKQFNVGLAISDQIRGNMIILGSPDSKGSETDIPESLLKKLEVS
jgi:hypothetical protein